MASRLLPRLFHGSWAAPAAHVHRVSLPKAHSRGLVTTCRAHSTDTDPLANGIPQTEAYPGIPKNTLTASSAAPETVVKTLPNGLVVGSEDVFGAWSTVGVIIDAGPRYEAGKFLGATHFLDRLAFKSTERRTRNEMFRQMVKLGGTFMCSSNRETVLYMASVFRSDVPEAMELLSEVILEPLISDEEVEEQMMLVNYEAEKLLETADQFLPELLHEAAFGAGGLGNRHLCTVEQAAAMTPDILREFRRESYTSRRMVVAGAGIEADVLQGLADQHFTGPLVDGAKSEATQSVYKGGESLVPLEESLTNNALHLPLTQVAVGFKGVSWTDKAVYAVCVLSVLLGGGGSFSAGGPGKGMYSRLYTNVLNQYSYLDSALAVNLSYADTGLFYIQFSCLPAQVLSGVYIMLNEMISSLALSDEEVDRAKNQLKSSLMMNLESKNIVFEDIGRQLIAGGKRLSAKQLCDHIDAVTKEDVQSAVRSMLKNPLSLAAYGNLDNMPPLATLQQELNRAVP